MKYTLILSIICLTSLFSCNKNEVLPLYNIRYIAYLEDTSQEMIVKYIDSGNIIVIDTVNGIFSKNIQTHVDSIGITANTFGIKSNTRIYAAIYVDNNLIQESINEDSVSVSYIFNK